MAKQVELEVAPRTVTGKATKQLRKADIIPAHIFGHQEESQMIQIDAFAFTRLLRTSTSANVITLHLPEHGAQTVVLRHVQRDPITDKVLHVDFLRMSMTETLKFKLALRFVGDAPAVKLSGGVLLHLLEALEVECAASNMVDHVDVDVSSLAKIDDMLHASDVTLPEHYTLLTDAAEPIVKVGATRAETAEAPAPAAAAPTASTSTSPEASGGA